eukprot:3556116-Rhodomonas_salina.1
MCDGHVRLRCDGHVGRGVAGRRTTTGQTLMTSSTKTAPPVHSHATLCCDPLSNRPFAATPCTMRPPLRPPALCALFLMTPLLSQRSASELR